MRISVSRVPSKESLRTVAMAELTHFCAAARRDAAVIIEIANRPVAGGDQFLNKLEAETPATTRGPRHSGPPPYRPKRGRSRRPR